MPNFPSLILRCEASDERPGLSLEGRTTVLRASRLGFASHLSMRR
jgi:hypothetical protein